MELTTSDWIAVASILVAVVFGILGVFHIRKRKKAKIA